MRDGQAWAAASDLKQREAVKRYRPIDQLIPAHWTASTLVANGIRQHYYRSGGAKPPLVLLHGILASGPTWLRVAQALEAEYDVIMPDARGHGQSERLGPEGIAYPLLVADVAALIAALELEKPFVLGHSMGGVIVALLAAAHPGSLRALVLEDAVWGDTSHMPQIGESDGYRAWLAAYTAYLTGLQTQTHEHRLLAALPYMPPGPTGLWPEEEYVPWVEAQAQVDLTLAQSGPALWTTMQPERTLAEVVREIDCPLLLLAGDPARGGLSQPQVVREVIATARDGEAVPFEAGHLIHLDAFERYISVVRGFLASK